MATITWNGGNGDWSDGMHWTGGRPPGAGDDAVIATASTVTITHPAVARSVTLNNAGAQVTLSSVLTLSSAGPGLLLDAGSFALARQAILRTNGGAITLAGSGASLTTAGTVVLGSGVLAVGTGMLHLLDHGVVNGQITVAHGGSIVADAGSALQLDLATVVAAEQATGGAISIAAGAQFTVRTGNAGPISATQLVAELASAGQFSNAGKTSLLVTSSVTNDGATLQIGNAIGWTIAGAGRLSGGNIVLNGGTFDDAGTVALSGGNLTVNGGTLLDRGTVALTGGTLAVNGGTFLDSGKVLLASGASVVVGGGSFGGSGVVSGGSVALRGGKLVLAGLTLDRVAYSGALNLGNADQLTLARGTTVASPGGVIGISGTATLRTDAATTLAGTTVDLGGGQLAAAALSGSTVVNLSGGVAAIGTLAAGGVVNHTGPGGTLQGDGGTLNTAARINAGAAGGTLQLAGTVVNAGQIVVSNGDAVALASGFLANASSGAIDVISGSLAILGTSQTAAALSNAAGATISVESGATFLDYFGTNADTINFNAGANVAVGSSLFAGTLGSVAGGGVNVSASAGLSVLTNQGETLAMFLADQNAIRADIGRSGFQLQVGNVLNLSPGEALSIGSTAPNNSLVVNGDLVSPSQRGSIAIAGGNTFVGAGGTLTLQDGNVYSGTGNTAQVILSAGGTLAANGDDTIIGNVFSNSASGGSTDTGRIVVGVGARLEIAGNFVNGNVVGGGAAPTTVLANSASLTIYDTAQQIPSADGVFFLNSNSSLYLQNYADLTGQSVQFVPGSFNDTVAFQDAPALAATGSLHAAFFGFGASDRILLPFTIGAISYNAGNGDVTLADQSGASGGAAFFVGTGYNATQFGGVGTSALTYGGAAPAALHHVG